MGLVRVASFPRLAPWAVFFCRFAAVLKESIGRKRAGTYTETDLGRRI